MSNAMFIPKVCRVGWQERSDTYSKKLAYVIYFDEKGKLRKETSWEGWRDKKIEPQDFTNEPFGGFILNKGIKRGGWDHFSQVVQKVRVFDPRCGGMEFEITINNLIYILMHDNCTKRELMGKYVYAWAGTELVLLPVSSEDYVESARVTDLKNTKVTAKDMVPGKSYFTKDGGNLLYVGRFDVHKYKEENRRVEGTMRKVKNGGYYGYEREEWDYEYVSEIVSSKHHVFKLLSGTPSGNSIPIKGETFMTLDGFQRLSRESEDVNQDLFNLASATFLQSSFNCREVTEVIEDKVSLEEWIAAIPSTPAYDYRYSVFKNRGDFRVKQTIYPKTEYEQALTRHVYKGQLHTDNHNSRQDYTFDKIPVARKPVTEEHRWDRTPFEVTPDHFGIKLKLANGSIVTFDEYTKNQG
jgi:hypothetical protein